MPTKKQNQAFQSDVDKAISDFNKTLKEAQRTVKMAEKTGTAKQIAKAQGFVKQLQDLQPMLDTLAKAKSPTATYSGPISQAAADQLNRDIQNKTMGGVGRGEYGPTGQRTVYAKGADVAGFEGYSSDDYYAQTGGTGISNTGKYYYNGKEVDENKFNTLVTEEAVSGGLGEDVTGGGDTGLYGGGSFYGSSGLGGTGTGSTGLGSMGGSDSWWNILRTKLLIAGIPQTTVDKSKNYFQTLITDLGGLDNSSIETAVDYFFYTKEYKSLSGQTFESPYYTDFGKFNEGLDRPKLPKDLVPTILGYKDLGKQYNISTQYLSDESIKKYLKNDVSVAEFGERVNTASLKAVTADDSYANALIKLGYISNKEQLTDFFLNPEIGTNEMKNRQKSAAFLAEAVRRSTPESQLTVNTDFAKQQAARYAEQGYSEAQISALASTGYENIADSLATTTKLVQMYEVPRGTTASTTLGADIQSELEKEEFMNMASLRRARVKQREIAAYSGSSGVGRLGSSGAGTF